LGDADHFAVTSDVSSMTSVRDAMKQILDKYKSPPDAVVNSAGITMDGFLVFNEPSSNSTFCNP
jgi:NAD(P)-dependent dehydrogenase (short-subunit alcohol dehydrogenase family)